MEIELCLKADNSQEVGRDLLCSFSSRVCVALTLNMPLVVAVRDKSVILVC